MVAFIRGFIREVAAIIEFPRALTRMKKNTGLYLAGEKKSGAHYNFISKKSLSKRIPMDYSILPF
ncbi:MAG: hypothetical protein JXJ04_21550 [Spirochaetales bacterium]|nr:hypothetical protein [Spirochaetales bacterium]